jgi:hypothetical protein
MNVAATLAEPGRAGRVRPPGTPVAGHAVPGIRDGFAGLRGGTRTGRDRAITQREPATAELESVIDRAERAARDAAAATARQLSAIAETIRLARANPQIFVPSEQCGGRDAVDFAERSAICELATALALTEATVRAQHAQAVTLQRRTPLLWSAFTRGEISAAHARIASEHAISLDDPGAWPEFDEELTRLADSAPTRFRSRARALTERLQVESLHTRHLRATAERRVWVEEAPDGMAWLGALLPADAAHRAMARLDAAANQLAAAPAESRTRAQLKADTLADLLTGDGTAHRVRATVSLTIPLATLLDPGNPDPATLDGRIPIDPQTARRLAADAPSLARILTDPISGVPVALDRRQYRIPADLKRWLTARHPTCVFPGCARPAPGCDLDHTTPWARGGTTSARNLAPLCRHHHRIKHHTRWHPRHQPDGRIHWTSPIGRHYTTLPPPF